MQHLKLLTFPAKFFFLNNEIKIEKVGQIFLIIFKDVTKTIN